jgi:hypothetical protein
MANFRVTSLANRILATHGSFLSNVKRIQVGFLAERNIQEARGYMVELQSILTEMEESLKQKPTQQSDNYIPMK